jgi:hypothetical protein
MPLEVLNRAFVFFRSSARTEGTEIAPLLGLGVHFAGINTILTVAQFSDHCLIAPIEGYLLRGEIVLPDARFPGDAVVADPVYPPGGE